MSTAKLLAFHVRRFESTMAVNISDMCVVWAGHSSPVRFSGLMLSREQQDKDTAEMIAAA